MTGDRVCVLSAGSITPQIPTVLCDRPPLAASVTPPSRRGQATTLKRNGSDFSATILGSLFRSSYITIWTDVDGVYSADPRKVGGCVGGIGRQCLLWRQGVAAAAAACMCVCCGGGLCRLLS